MFSPAANGRRIVDGDLTAGAIVLNGLTADHLSLPRALCSSVVHKHSEKKNDRQRNANEPEQGTFSETHDSLQFMLQSERLSRSSFTSSICKNLNRQGSPTLHRPCGCAPTRDAR